MELKNEYTPKWEHYSSEIGVEMYFVIMPVNNQ